MQFFSAEVKAGDDSRFSYYWLNDFFSRGIKSAYAEYEYVLDTAYQKSEYYSKTATSKIEFDFATKIYKYHYVFEYREDWAILTNQNSEAPPVQVEKFVGSKIESWKKVGDLGIYKEVFDRVLPNWLHFENLDSLMIDQAIFSNPLPVLSGIFNADEFKALKKIKKRDEAKGNSKGPWTCFEYDNASNVVEVSRQYLYSLKKENLTKNKKIVSSFISIRNYEDEIVFIEVLIPETYPAIIEGISVKFGDMKTKIYNFEINTLFSKFIPELVSDPNVLIAQYFKQIQVDYACDLSRFEND